MTDNIARLLALMGGNGGSGGTTDYEALTNKPSIGGVTLIGDMTLAELGIIVDDQLNAQSTNPVQNAVLTALLNAFPYSNVTGKPQINGVTLTGNVTLAQLGLNALWVGTQAEYAQVASTLAEGTLVVITDDNDIDSTPTENSTNMVMSGGVYAFVIQGLDNKVDKVQGKGLSTEDYTTAEKTKLGGIEAEANKTVVDSALSDSSTNPVQNKIIKTTLDGKASITLLSAEAAARTAEDDTINARIDEIVALPSGSTQGDAELADIRVGDDTVIYGSAGQAVRTQIGALRSEAKLVNNGDTYFDVYANFVRGTIIDGEINTGYYYRVATNDIMTFDRDIILKIANGFRIAAFYFEGSVHTGNSGYQYNEFKIVSGTSFKLEINKSPEVIETANIQEFVHAVSFQTKLGQTADLYLNELSIRLAPAATYEGYYKLNGTALTSDTTQWTKKYKIPTGTTKIYVKSRFFALTGVAFSDIGDPTETPLGYPANCTKDPLQAYAVLTDHVVTYTLDRYYKYLYVPYYKSWGEPEIIAYRESAFNTFWKGIHPLAGKNILVFGDSITYTASRWRDEFYKITRAKELACISYPGAHLTDYNATTPLDGNYTSTADGGVHNVVCNQVYYWLNTGSVSADVPDVIIISAGTNDTQSAEQLDTDINVYTDSSGWLDVDAIERTSFEGAMRWICSKLRTKYPKAVIVFASPIQAAETIHPMEYQLKKEAKMERVCKRLSAGIVKATSKSGITGEFEIQDADGRYLIDGLHPNANGGKVLGSYYASKMETMMSRIVNGGDDA